MPFGKMGIRAWSREWRMSDWRETIPLASGRECPDCFATVCSGKSWRAHATMHAEEAAQLEQLDQAVRTLARAVRMLAVEAGHGDWYDAGERPELDEYAGDEPEALTGYVIGSGPLPAETRGGGE